MPSLAATLLFAMAPGLPAPAGVDPPSSSARDQRYRELVRAEFVATIAPAIESIATIEPALRAAQEARRNWLPYSTEWQRWTAADARYHEPGYAWAEFAWTIARDRAFRESHTELDVARDVQRALMAPGSGGLVRRAALVDSNGGLAAGVNWTDDWFQGDESPFREVDGRRSVFIDRPVRDHSDATPQVTIAIPIWDQTEPPLRSDAVLDGTGSESGGGAFLGALILVVTPREPG